MNHFGLDCSWRKITAWQAVTSPFSPSLPALNSRVPSIDAQCHQVSEWLTVKLSKTWGNMQNTILSCLLSYSVPMSGLVAFAVPRPLNNVFFLPLNESETAREMLGLHTLRLHAPLVHPSSLQTDTMTDKTPAAALTIGGLQLFRVHLKTLWGFVLRWNLFVTWRRSKYISNKDNHTQI